MTAQIQTTPKTVSVLGDSYSSGAIDKAMGAAYSPLSSIGAGSAGEFIVLEGRSFGGMAAADLVNNTGPWLNDLQMGGTFAFCAPYDVARYQVFRYGINEAVRRNADDTYTHCMPTFEANLRSLVDALAGVVPLGIPLLTGPGAMSTVIVMAHNAKQPMDYAAIIGSGVVIAILVWLTLQMAQPIARTLGRTGINIATRIMGLLVAAVAVEFIVDGLTAMIPALAH